MNILGTPLHRIDWDFLDALARDRVPESLTHDYKTMLPNKRDENGRKRVLKSASAFANTNGGVLIFGLDAESEPEWKLSGLEGFNEDNDVLSLTNWLRSGINPPLPATHPRIIRNRDETKTILLLGIPRSLASPHELSSANGGGFWCREVRGNSPMGVNELRRAFQEAEAWRSEITEFRNNRIKFLNEGGVHNTLTPAQGFAFLHVLPLGRLSELVETKPLLQLWQSKIRHYGTEEVKIARTNIDGWLDCSIFDAQLQEYTQVFRSGGVEFYWSLPNFENSYQVLKQSIQGTELEAKIVSAATRAMESLTTCGVAPPFAVSLGLHEVRGYKLVFGQRRAMKDVFDRQRLDFPLLVLEEHPEDIAKGLRPLFDSIWMAAGWQESPMYNEAGEWLLAGRKLDEFES